MQLSNLLLLGLGLSSTTSAYVVTLYKGPNCTGASKRNNVWDNTCSTPNFGAKSVRVEVYGGRGQKARFHVANSCSLHDVLAGPWDAANPNHSFRAGNCIDFGRGRYANAFGSFAA